MSPGGSGTSTSVVKLLLDRVTKHCGKIAVAKKETSDLADLCTTLSNILSDRSLTSQQPNYDDLKSELVKVEEQLASWSKYNYLKSMMKRKDIEAGVTGFVEKLGSIISQGSAIQPDRRSNGGSLPRGRPSYDSSSIMTANRESSPRQTMEPEIPDSRSVETSQQPPVRNLNGEVTKNEELAFIGGPHCEVWIGLWEKGGGEKGSGEVIGGEKVSGKGVDEEGADVERVALKALRITRSPEDTRKRLEHELPRWAELRHQNILPFYGTIEIRQRLYMVSPWRENGNLLVYVKKNPLPDKNYLLRGSAAGLSYLHSMGLVHGNVKCNNVLVSQEGEPQICDFGIVAIMEERNENTISKTVTSAAIVRYAAPEVIENNNPSVTTHSDTYSFAMLILECITEDVPFSNITRDAAVVHARISKRQCPPRPEGLEEKNRVSDGLWDLMKRCWSIKPDHRPTMERVHRFFLEQT